jgi:hypothetical protein
VGYAATGLTGAAGDENRHGFSLGRRMEDENAW